MERDTVRKRWYRMEWASKGRAWKSERRQRMIDRLLGIAIGGDDRAMGILAEFADNGGLALPVRSCANR